MTKPEEPERPEDPESELPFEAYLALHAEGALTPDMRARIADPSSVHARRYAEAGELLALLEEASLEPVSKQLHERALRVASHPGPKTDKDTGRSPLRALIAVLVEPRAELRPALRGGASDNQLLFRAEAHDVDLILTENGALIGQILADDEAGPVAFDGGYCVLSSAGQHRTSELNAHGEFRFPDAGAGPHAFFARFEERTIGIPLLRFGPASEDTGS